MVVFTAHDVLHDLPLLVPAILVLNPIRIFAHISGLMRIDVPLLILQNSGSLLRVLFETIGVFHIAICDIFLCDRVVFLVRLGFVRIRAVHPGLVMHEVILIKRVNDLSILVDKRHLEIVSLQF